MNLEAVIAEANERLARQEQEAFDALRMRQRFVWEHARRRAGQLWRNDRINPLAAGKGQPVRKP